MLRSRLEAAWAGKADPRSKGQYRGRCLSVTRNGCAQGNARSSESAARCRGRRILHGGRQFGLPLSVHAGTGSKAGEAMYATQRRKSAASDEEEADNVTFAPRKRRWVTKGKRQ